MKKVSKSRRKSSVSMVRWLTTTMLKLRQQMTLQVQTLPTSCQVAKSFTYVKSASKLPKCCSLLLMTLTWKWKMVFTSSLMMRSWSAIETFTRIFSTTLCLLAEVPCSKACRRAWIKKFRLWLPRQWSLRSKHLPIVSIQLGLVELFSVKFLSLKICGSLAKNLMKKAKVSYIRNATDYNDF